MFFNKNDQKGSSMMEALAFISIVSMLSASAFKVISNANGTFKMTMATSEIKELQKAISGVYDYSGDYNELFNNDTYKVLCETDKSVPNQMCIKKGSGYGLRHRLGGAVEITKGSDAKSYLIKFKGLTKKNCIKMTQIDWLERKKISIYQLDANDTAIAYFPKRGEKGFPISAAASFAGCNKKDGENAITWYFY